MQAGLLASIGSSIAKASHHEKRLCSSCCGCIDTPSPAVPAPQIISEVVQQLSKMFQADVRMIKKQVESLIDREYLKRDEVTASFHTDRTFAAQNAYIVLQN